MSKFTMQIATVSMVAVADATNYSDNQYFALQGGSATQLVEITEAYLMGQAAAAAAVILIGAVDLVVGATLTALGSPDSNAPLHRSTAALAAPTVGFKASTTKPQRGSAITIPKLNFSFNAFGGQAIWRRNDGDGFFILGNAASGGEFSVSNFTGGATASIGAHLIHEAA